MHALLDYMTRNRDSILADISRLASIESPTSDPAAVNRAVDWVARQAADLGRIERVPTDDYGDRLRIEFELPGGADGGQVLGLGHLDTVYPLGALDSMPVRESDERLFGPGVFDMKAGVVFFLYAARALRELALPARRRFVLLLNPDEEVGSPASRPATEAEARNSSAVLVAEPSYGPAGAVKTARKGGGKFHIDVRGRPAHAGLDFAAGASAIVELARQIDRIASWTDLDQGVTVNPGLIRGGTGANVVAERASADIDIRVPRPDQAQRIEARFRALTPFDPRTEISVSGGLTRPPLVRTEAVAALYEKARALSAEFGRDLPEASVGGGSDGNFTAALGIPTLDGLGAVGEGAHSPNENILLDRIPDRAALLARLIAEC